MDDPILIRSLTVTMLAGAECGLAGVFIFLMNIPFVGVAVAHAAMAGGIWGLVFGLPARLSAFVVSIASALLVGPVTERAKVSANTAVSILFSMMMGFAFLGIGVLGSAGSEVTGFLWGNVFMAGAGDLAVISVVLAAVAAVAFIFRARFSVVFFSRELAESYGVGVKTVITLVLLMISAVIAVNLNIIGGLMLFSLIITPPAIAYQLSFNLRNFFIIAALSGALSGAAGVLVSYFFDLPVSASVVLCAGILFFISMALSPKRKAYGKA